MKANAGKINPGRKPGNEGLPYKDASKVVGGKPENQIEGSGLGAGHEVKGSSKIKGA